MMIDSVLGYSYDISIINSESQHFTVVFNAFIMMTLFNEINARKISGERNVFKDIHKNPYYYIIWIICFFGQVIEILVNKKKLILIFLFFEVIIVQVGGKVFSCVALEIDHWIWCLFLGICTLIWHQLMLFIPDSFVESLTSCNCKKAKVDSIKSDYYKGNGVDSHTSIDIDKLAQSKILWVRGIGRIHNQLDVVSAFKARLEESVKSRSLNGSRSSLREQR